MPDPPDSVNAVAAAWVRDCKTGALVDKLVRAEDAATSPSPARRPTPTPPPPDPRSRGPGSTAAGRAAARQIWDARGDDAAAGDEDDAQEVTDHDDDARTA